MTSTKEMTKLGGKFPVGRGQRFWVYAQMRRGPGDGQRCSASGARRKKGGNKWEQTDSPTVTPHFSRKRNKRSKQSKQGQWERVDVAKHRQPSLRLKYGSLHTILWTRMRQLFPPRERSKPPFLRIASSALESDPCSMSLETYPWLLLSFMPLPKSCQQKCPLNRWHC